MRWPNLCLLKAFTVLFLFFKLKLLSQGFVLSFMASQTLNFPNSMFAESLLATSLKPHSFFQITAVGSALAQRLPGSQIVTSTEKLCSPLGDALFPGQESGHSCALLADAWHTRGPNRSSSRLTCVYNSPLNRSRVNYTHFQWTQLFGALSSPLQAGAFSPNSRAGALFSDEYRSSHAAPFCSNVSCIYFFPGPHYPV